MIEIKNDAQELIIKIKKTNVRKTVNIFYIIGIIYLSMVALSFHYPDAFTVTTHSGKCNDCPTIKYTITGKKIICGFWTGAATGKYCATEKEIEASKN